MQTIHHLNPPWLLHGKWTPGQGSSVEAGRTARKLLKSGQVMWMITAKEVRMKAETGAFFRTTLKTAGGHLCVHMCMCVW